MIMIERFGSPCEDVAMKSSGRTPMSRSKQIIINFRIFLYFVRTTCKQKEDPFVLMPQCKQNSNAHPTVVGV